MNLVAKFSHRKRCYQANATSLVDKKMKSKHWIHLTWSIHILMDTLILKNKLTMIQR
uniref:Uncharacterized protein n=1 Tax=Zea mays TaxID=4577 RepID=B6SL43_MAIZE|nr:hypothetical protein [Zea mays]ACG45614.1 hypothetical protein [Zea mays]